MSTNAFPYGDINHLSRVFKLLGEPSRLRILYSLELECRPVSDIVAATGLTQTNVSFHLRTLREAGLVRPERRGSFVYYCLPDTRLLAILAELRGWLDLRAAETVTVGKVARSGGNRR